MSDRKAESYVLDLLARRQRTVWEMERKLRSKDYPEEVIENLLGRLVRIGYLDDRRFAETWVEERLRTRPSGKALLSAELRRKGVDAGIVASVLAEALPAETEDEMALRAARKKWAAVGRATAEGRKRLWSFLRRRGFNLAACQRALRQVAGAVEDFEEVVEEPGEDLPRDLDQSLLPGGAARGLTS